ncbi:MAG: hypothetical protein F6J93_02875 [Oscillatoria sp. SIO1A7]|nr:hypothetical protein [Oscillatoria sp. SIO1A7]
MGTWGPGDWETGGLGDKGHGYKGTMGPTNVQCPMSNAQFPIPNSQ